MTDLAKDCARSSEQLHLLAGLQTRINAAISETMREVAEDQATPAESEWYESMEHADVHYLDEYRDAADQDRKEHR